MRADYDVVYSRDKTAVILKANLEDGWGVSKKLTVSSGKCGFGIEGFPRQDHARRTCAARDFWRARGEIPGHHHSTK